MKKFKFLTTIVLFIGISISSNAQVSYGIDTILVKNQFTTLDTIPITTAGWLHSPAYGFGESTINVEGDSIFISIELIFGAEPIDNYWTVSFKLDPLVEGKYIIKAKAYLFGSNRNRYNTKIDSFLVTNSLGYKDNLLSQERDILTNYPNPANSSTTITFTIIQSNFYDLNIYNSSGKEVRRANSVWYEKGEHFVKFDLEGLPSGIYIYTLKSDQIFHSGKMVKK